mgnify:CR=1 FL=1
MQQAEVALHRAVASNRVVRSFPSRGDMLDWSPDGTWLSMLVLRTQLAEVDAGVVISNADLDQTLDVLLGPEHVDPAYRAEVASLVPSFPCFLTHVGLTGVPDEVLEEAQGYYWQEWDPDLVGRGGLRCKIFSPTLYEPRMAPPGGQVVILQKVLEMDYRTVTDWDAHKRQVEEYVLGHFRRVVPGVEEKIVVHLSASAKTSHRFTLNREGAMLGWAMSPEQLGDARPAIESPVPGLYLVGHWTRPGGGITPVMMSAVHVAQAITRSRVLPAVAPVPVTLDGIVR